MSEIICIHIGQAGVQIGESVWELLSKEHKIEPDGERDQEGGGSYRHHSVFREKINGKMTPRSIFIDLEPGVIDEMKNGRYRDLYETENLISGMEDAANIYARGRYSVGKETFSRAYRRIQKIVEEDCISLQGFIIFHSLGGGCGSGFASLLFEKLCDDYPKKSKFGFTLYPTCNVYNSIVEPYNAVLSTSMIKNSSNVEILFDNDALYQICGKYLDIPFPNYSHTNRLISQVYSSLTSSMRTLRTSDSSLPTDLIEFQTNAIPYPNLHYLLPSFSPFHSYEKVFHEKNPDLVKMTKSLFHRDNTMSSCDMRHGKFMSCSLFYRGEISPKEIVDTLRELDVDRQTLRRKHFYRGAPRFTKQYYGPQNTEDRSFRRNFQFVDWVPCKFKVALNPTNPSLVPIGRVMGFDYNSPSSSSTSSFSKRCNRYSRGEELVQLDRSVCMISNTTAIAEVFSRQDHRFDLLFAKRAFCHWYVQEGMEESEFSQAREDLAMLERDYEGSSWNDYEAEGEWGE